MPIVVELGSQTEAAVQRAASQRGLSVDELVKRAVELVLATTPADVAAMGPGWPDSDVLGPSLTGATRAEARRRARSFIGLVTDGPTDFSRNHDKYIAEAFEP